MRKSLVICLLSVSLSLVACSRMKGTYRCVFNCACKDRNIIHELEFVDSRSVIIHDSVDRKTVKYRVDGKRIELDGIERAGSITVLDNRTIVIQGSDCLSGTYRRVF